MKSFFCFLLLCSTAHATEMLFSIKEDFTVEQSPSYLYSAEALGSGATLSASLPTTIHQILHIDASSAPDFTAAIHLNPTLHLRVNQAMVTRLPGAYPVLAPTTIQYYEVDPVSWFSDGSGHTLYTVALRGYGVLPIVPEPSGALVLLGLPLLFARKR